MNGKLCKKSGEKKGCECIYFLQAEESIEQNVRKKMKMEKRKRMKQKGTSMVTV